MPRRSAAPLSLVVIVGVALLWALAMPAPGSAATITSAGPVTEISISPTLECNARYAGDTAYEFFGGTQGSCGPFVTRGTTNFPFGGFIPVDQSAVTGSGAAGDPFRVITTVCAGSQTECDAATAPLVTYEVRYVTGQDFYRTDVQVTSRGAPETIGIYTYADCYLQDSDRGFGYYDAASGGIYCRGADANSQPADRLEGFVPINAGSSWYEAGYSTTYNAIYSNAGAPLPNSCECDVLQDNGMALGWTGISLPTSGAARRAFLTTFSPTGVVPDPAPTVTLTSPAPNSQSADATPTYGGAAGDQLGDSPTVTVEVYAGDSIPETAPLHTLSATRAGGAWAVEDTTPLAPGTYTARARQTDDGGNEGISAPTTFTIVASSPPPPPPDTTITISPGPTTGTGSPTFAFASSVPGARFECRVDAAPFAPCTSPFTTPALSPGTHTFAVRGVDAAGNADPTPASVTFTVTDRDGDGIPDAQDKSDASAGPTLAKTIVASVVSGEVFYSLPGSGSRATPAAGTNGRIPLKGAEILPLGATVYTERGRVQITSAAATVNGRKQTQHADFYQGRFKIRQRRAKRPITDIDVQSPDFAKVCGTSSSRFSTYAVKKKKSSKKVVTQLQGDGKGSFRTTGRNSAATVRGTKWLTQERCDGTLTRVSRGIVSVRDTTAHRTVLVRAGHSYLARAQRAAIKTSRP
ncbi:MAG: hypothetical protein QOJ35_738 [Solirubrobacteraceae bacterium]|jgi:hypothetical protein|nr:hypothetical protein [Solirubrobacteraceae bacterium]